MLARIRQQIDKSLDEFLKKIRRGYELDLVDPILYESIRDFVLRPGKRIRPTLLILSYKGYRRSRRRMSPSIYYVSTCVELLHNFMLVHDDIIDNSNLRRGKPTMHRLLRRAVPGPGRETLGRDLGIVVGDIIYAAAFDAFLSINEDLARKEKALKFFIQTAIFTAMGEFIDTVHGVRGLARITEDDVLLNYSLKTARYTFECPLVVGALLAGAARRDVERLNEMGRLVGQAFQMQDDIIGVFATQKNIGKSILSDIAESKKTILVCHANRTLQGAARKRFLACFNKPHKTYADLVTMRKIFLQAGSLAYTLGEIRRRVDRSLAIMEQLRMKSRYRGPLEHLIVRLFEQSDTVAKRNLPG